MNPNCIVAVEQAAAKLGRAITRSEIQGMEKRVTDNLKQLAIQDPQKYRAMTRNERLEQAGKMVSDQLTHDAIIKARNAELQVIAVRQIEADVERAMTKSNLSYSGSLKRMMGFKADIKGYSQSVDERAQARAYGYIREINKALDLDREGTLGGLFTNKEGTDALVREAKGEDSGNANAKAAWEQINALNNKILKEYNDLGGDIAQLKGYVPQKMDAFRVYGAGKQKWVDDAMKSVDRSKYYDLDGNLLDDVGMRKFLEESFVTLATDGYNKTGNRREYASSLANRHKAHRDLHWKDGDAHINMMETYGAGSVMDQIMGHIQRLSNEMTLMERFGPNALHTVSLLVERAKDVDGATNKAAMKELASFENMADLFSGAKGGVEFTKVGVNRFFRAAKDINVSTLLGSILTSQLADNGSAMANARAIGMSLSQWGIHKTAYYGSPKMKEFARSAGVSFSHMANTMARWGDDMSNSMITGKLAATTMKVSGANFTTMMHREAFATFILDQIGGMSRKYEWGAMPTHDRGLLERRGFTKTDWDIIRAAEVDNTYGGTGVSATQIERVSDDVIRKINPKKFNTEKAIQDARQDAALKLNGYAIMEAQMAILQPSLEVRSLLDYEKGNVFSELGHALAQFKTFPIAFYKQHLVDRARMNEGKFNPISYRLSIIAMTSVLGGLGLLMGDIATGRDPREVFDPEDNTKAMKFGFQALMKGGGLGVWGDILNADWEGRDPIEQVSGPTVGKLVSIAKLGKEGFDVATGAEDTKFSKKFIDTAKNFTPFQNLIWTRAAFHNYLMAELNEMAQPGYMSRIQGLAEKNYDSEYFMGYGNDLRAPNFGNIVAE